MTLLSRPKNFPVPCREEKTADDEPMARQGWNPGFSFWKKVKLNGAENLASKCQKNVSFPAPSETASAYVRSTRLGKSLEFKAPQNVKKSRANQMSVFSHLAITQGVDGTLSEICASPLPSSFLVSMNSGPDFFCPVSWAKVSESAWGGRGMRGKNEGSLKMWVKMLYYLQYSP